MSSDAMQVYQIIERTQNFCKNYRSRVRGIEMYPQMRTTFEKRVKEAKAKLDAAQREYNEVVAKLAKEDEDHEKSKLYVKENQQKFDDYEKLISDEAVKLAETIKSNLEKLA